jgi:hypothetical protein
VALSQEDIAFIKAHMAEWLTKQSLDMPAAVYEIELRERIVRVEEELRHQRELMQQGFERVDNCFEQVDSRFDEMIRRHDRHFLWLIGFITSVGALIIAAGKFW